MATLEERIRAAAEEGEAALEAILNEIAEIEGNLSRIRRLLKPILGDVKGSPTNEPEIPHEIRSYIGSKLGLATHFKNLTQRQAARIRKNWLSKPDSEWFRMMAADKEASPLPIRAPGDFVIPSKRSLSSGQNELRQDLVCCGDSFKILRDFSSFFRGKIDLVLTSPPYGDMFHFDGKSPIHDSDSCLAEFFISLSTVLKDDGFVCWVVRNQYHDGRMVLSSEQQALVACDACFEVHDKIVRVNPYPHYPRKNRHKPATEDVWVFKKPVPKGSTPRHVNVIRDEAVKNKGREIPVVHRKRGSGEKVTRNVRLVNGHTDRSNVWSVPAGSGRKFEGLLKRLGMDTKTSHPAAMPEILAEDLIITYTDMGNTVLDCFAGYGTTGKMAALNGRHYVLLEINKAYCQVAVERIGEALKGRE